MLNKRGQITIFVIIAVLILAIVGIYYITSNKGINQDPITAETAPIYDGVYKCIEDTAIDALYYIGLTGGYYFSPILSDENGVAFYYYEGENFMLSKEQLAEEISLTIDNTLHFCTNEVLNITEFNITKGNITTNIEIGENKISINVEYPLTISKEDSNSILKNWFYQRLLQKKKLWLSKNIKHQLTTLNTKEFKQFSDNIWDSINKVNLEENIYPYRNRSNLIIVKDKYHKIYKVVYNR